jgi:hypothetical protein
VRERRAVAIEHGDEVLQAHAGDRMIAEYTHAGFPHQRALDIARMPGVERAAQAVAEVAGQRKPQHRRDHGQHQQSARAPHRQHHGQRTDQSQPGAARVARRQADGRGRAGGEGTQAPRPLARRDRDADRETGQHHHLETERIQVPPNPIARAGK